MADGFVRAEGRATKKRRRAPGKLELWLRAHVDHQGNECVLWPFGKTPQGYGHLSVNGRQGNAHRFMCEWAHGLPKSGGRRGLHAAHSCGRQDCVNPNHLRWATVAENHADKKRHGTQTYGAEHPSGKLTNDDILVAQLLLLRGVPQAAVAERLKCAQATVSRISLGKRGPAPVYALAITQQQGAAA